MSSRTPQKKSPQRQRRANDPKARRRDPTSEAEAPILSDLPSGDADEGERLVAVWHDSRPGARAGRGFHFQDAVAAWLASEVAAGRIGGDSVTPEGLEDVVVEGSAPLDVQVKSRVTHLDRFAPRLAAQHVVDAWLRRRERDSPSRRLIVVLERGVTGEEGLTSIQTPLEASLAGDSRLRISIAEVARERGVDGAELLKMMGATAVFATSWDWLAHESADAAQTLVELPPSARELLARYIRTVMADAADANVACSYEERRTVARTELVAKITGFATHIDLDSLEGAIRSGICEPFTMPQADPDERFYEGESTQPHHVAAGLVVPRPDVVAEVAAGLADRSAVVLTGPSGVGKSAVLWTVPLAIPGALWFRVRRLRHDDVAAIIRLARAYNASEAAPVAFLVDGAGLGESRAWAHLRAEAAAIPGLLLLGSARREDLSSLGDLSACTTVTVQLDETSAEVIFNGLRRRGSTSAPHWREAYERSSYLTLEFTYMLTQGRRLDEVIREQIRRRVDEGRDVELEVVRLVSLADQCGVSLGTGLVADACGVTAFELKTATSRLSNEHLIVENNGVMTGLHRVRSMAITRAIHEDPPPSLDSTVRVLLGVLPTAELHRFVANVLQLDESLDEVVVEAASLDLEAERLVAYLHGLRLADFHDLAKAWKAIADDHDVPAMNQPILFQFVAGELEVPEIFPEPLLRASRDMARERGPDRACRLAQKIGIPALATMLLTSETTEAATHLVAALSSLGAAMCEELRSHDVASSRLLEGLEAASIEEVAEFVAAARAGDLALAQLLVDAMGGVETVLARIRLWDPWMTELEIVTAESESTEDRTELVGRCRFLHFSDELQEDARKRAVKIGQLLLRCVPSIESVDVQALLAGGQPIQIGEYTHGVSHLRRRYDHTALNVSWNQARLRAAAVILGATDTERLSAALPLLEEARYILREAALLVVLGRSANVNAVDLDHRWSQLHQAARSLRPPLGGVELADTQLGEEAGLPSNDSLSGLLTDLTGNVFSRLGQVSTYPALSQFIAETVLARHMEEVRGEPWYLLGVDDHPSALDELAIDLADLHAVLGEFGSDGDLRKVVQSARAGQRAGVLHRAAATSRRSATRRGERRRRALIDLCRRKLETANVLQPPVGDTSPPLTEWAITVELKSLLDWPDALASLVGDLDAARVVSETFLLIPLRNGRPVPSLAMRLIRTLMPSTDLGDWASQLNEPQSSTTADLFSEIFEVLQTFSALDELPEDQQTHPDVLKVTDVVKTRLSDAATRLHDLPQDEMMDGLRALVGQVAAAVEEQLTGQSDGEGLAAQLAAALVGAGSRPINDTLLGARYLALEWDIDRERAISLLDA